MKVLSTVTFLLGFIICQAQEVKFSELKNGKPGNYDSYLASDGYTYKIGDRIKIGIPSANHRFVFIKEGDGILTPFEPGGSHLAGNEAEIKKIMVVGTKRSGYSVSFRMKGVTFLNNFTIFFEDALKVKEVNGYGKSSDQALEELKKAKDKLDLGLITQEEYDKIKAELSVYIK